MTFLYNISSGPFGLCNNVLNEKTKKIENSDITQITNCCLSTCLPVIEKCRNYCDTLKEPNNKKSCLMTCDRDIKGACVDNCMLVNDMWETPDMKNIFRDFGCGDGEEFDIDKKCAEINKPSIIEACNNRCIPSSKIDCHKYCDFSYNFLVNPESNILNSKEDEIKENIHFKIVNKPSYFFLIFIVILVLVVLSIIIKMIMKLFGK